MRPCPACGAACENHARQCPECDASLVRPSPADNPPPGGPGVSGGPDEQALMRRCLIAAVLGAVAGAMIGLSAWGPLGLLLGIPAIGAAILVTLLTTG